MKTLYWIKNGGVNVARIGVYEDGRGKEEEEEEAEEEENEEKE